MLTAFAIPALRDNYVWLLKGDSDRVAVVDPGEAGPVIQHLQGNNMELAAILITHHHLDHIGGIRDLTHYRSVPVFGPAAENIDAVSEPLAPDTEFRVPGIDYRFTALATPGHTNGQVAYCGADYAFTGDTLFSAGCGRLFEGTAEEMWASLRRLRELPAATRVCCGHEYTERNLRFAAQVEPDNAAIGERLAWARQRQADAQPTLPSTIGDEMRFNPFLRADLESVRAAAERHAAKSLNNPAQVFAQLRAWKDSF